jgi:hypothetical protein
VFAGVMKMSEAAEEAEETEEGNAEGCKEPVPEEA